MERRPLVYKDNGWPGPLPQGDVLPGAFGMVPDWGNVETIYQVDYTAGAGQWTADRVGYVYSSGNIFIAVAQENNGYVTFSFQINDKSVVYEISRSNPPAAYRFPLNVQATPVKPGDVVKWGMGKTEDITSFQPTLFVGFIPPKFISEQAPVIVNPGVSYSQSEVATGETWIDGKPIYRRVFEGTLSLPSIYSGGTAYLMEGVSEIVNCGGWLRMSASGDRYGLGQRLNNDDTNIQSALYIPNGTSNLNMWFRSSIDLTPENHGYRIWAEYTKV
jgi:hypothetical protein